MSATTTRDAKADAALALLCERWPKCFFMFQGRRLPLKIGIHKDIPDGLIEPKILRLAFRLYVNNPGYLNAMRLGAARVDLNGEVAGSARTERKSAQRRSPSGIMNRAQRRKAESEFRRRPPDRYGYIVISSDDLVARPPPDMAEVVKAAGVDPNIPFNGLPSPWKKDDAAWFEAHPHRAHRVRDRFPYERFKGEPSDLPNAAISKIIVRQSGPACASEQAFVIVEERDPDAIAVLREMIEMAELRKSVAHALFEAAQNSGRPVQIHEIVAMIEQYESAAARAVS